MQRAAISLPVNIAEGFGRRHARDKARFYEIAHSSGEELKNLLMFARDTALVNPETFESLIGRVDETCRMLHGLIERMDSRNDP